jgi:hypothetical protein
VEPNKCQKDIILLYYQCDEHSVAGAHTCRCSAALRWMYNLVEGDVTFARICAWGTRRLRDGAQ